LPLASQLRLQGRLGLPRSLFYSDSPRGVGSVIDVRVIPYFVFDEE
jgi:hypothetical protein